MAVRGTGRETSPPSRPRGERSPVPQRRLAASRAEGLAPPSPGPGWPPGSGRRSCPGRGGGAASPLQLSPCFSSRSWGSVGKGRSALCKQLGALMGTWPWASLFLNGHELGNCGWMFLRVLVTALRGQIFSCFLDYNNWSPAGECVWGGTCAFPMYVGCAVILSGFMSSCLKLTCCGLFWG